MTLPGSGTLTFAQIATEAGTAFPVTIPNDRWRTLAGVPSGALVFPAHFHAKSNFEYLGLLGSAGQAIGGIPFGGAGPSRLVFVAIHYNGSASSPPAVASVTIGGVAAALIVSNANRNTATSEIVGAAIAVAAVAAGTSGTVSFTVTTGTVTACAIASYREIRSFTSPSSAVDDANASTKPATATLSVPSNGVCIAASTLSSAGVAIDWPAGPSAEPYDSAAGTMRVSGRYQNGMGANGAFNTQSTWASGDLGMALSVLAWQA